MFYTDVARFKIGNCNKPIMIRQLRIIGVMHQTPNGLFSLIDQTGQARQRSDGEMDIIVRSWCCI